MPRTVFVRNLNRNRDAWGSRKQVLAWALLQQPTFHRNRFLKEFGVDVSRFLEASGHSFSSFGALETGIDYVES